MREYFVVFDIVSVGCICMNVCFFGFQELKADYQGGLQLVS